MPKLRAAVIVVPLLEKPGINAANTWLEPINIACLNVSPSMFVSALHFLSTKYNMIPITANAIAITITFSLIGAVKPSNNNPIIAAGMEPATIYQNIFPSCFKLLKDILPSLPLKRKHSLNIAMKSLKKYIPIASNVPK